MADVETTPSSPVIARLGSLQAGVYIIATILMGATLFYLRSILTPLLLAVFLLLMIDGMARVLVKRVKGFPSRLALPTAIATIVALFVLSIWLVVDNGREFATHGPAYAQRLNAVIKQAGDRFGVQTPPTLDDLFDQMNPTRYIRPVLKGLREAGEGAVFVLIYLGFLLASRRGFEAKIGALFASPGRQKEAKQLFNRIRIGVESYIWTQTVVGLIIASLSAVIMWPLGLSHVPFWCFIIFLANYIPAIGAAIGVLLPPLFGLVEFNDLVRPIGMLVALEAVHFSVSHVVQPRMQGQSLNLDPIVILLALTFWGVLWGVTGAFLSTPLTVVAMALLAEFPGTRPLAVLLSSDGKPFAKA